MKESSRLAPSLGEVRLLPLPRALTEKMVVERQEEVSSKAKAENK